ncbi:hypothetical protein OQH60_02235 [Campylobacter sp. MIT 21-1685]|uniref:hypothetical protein n=1 Tax=unclassified Campylobacter TaxID=2593542 RepID=UPI00224B6B30|nr:MULTISPECIES: hypothetical protein [unclassified Campylobacter]MCX2682611.1 hypothetical protein [Campylobacter sp. MIT 21-1684]MCX2807176.1 hypothetical protein [Campylobacter sp. MIT 21-1685]
MTTFALFASWNPYHKIVDDRRSQEHNIYKADINSVIVQRDKEELQALDEKISKLESSVSEEQAQMEEGLLKVYFANAGGEITSIALSSQSVFALERNFGEVHKRKDGSYLLNGESSAFVSGWYRIIAQSANYLKADKDANGIIDDEENLKLKTVFFPASFCLDYASPVLETFGLKTYREFGSLNEEQRKQFKEVFVSDTLNLALDKVLKQDFDFDGEIFYKEMDTGFRDSYVKALVMPIVEENLESLLSQEELNKRIEEQKAKIVAEVKKRSEEKFNIDENDENREELRLKLLQQGFENLTFNEKILAQKYFPHMFKEKELNQEDSKTFTKLVFEIEQNISKAKIQSTNSQNLLDFEI